MSYPGYPPYPQGRGQGGEVPPSAPMYQTAPLSYPMYPGAAAPQPGFGAPAAGHYPSVGSSYPPAGQAPYPPAGQSPYPGGVSVYPPATGSSPYPPAGSSPYPPAAGSSPYPPSTGSSPYPPSTGSSPYPPTGSSPYPPTGHSPYPATTGSSPYPPSTGSSPYPPSTGSSPYPPTGHSPYPPSTGSSPYPPTGSSPYPPTGQTHSPYPPTTHGAPSSSPYPKSAGHQGYAPHSTSQHTMKPGNPTVRPAQPFNPRSDAEVLRKAMKGFGTDEKAIIEVLTHRSNQQRQQIALEFKTLYGKDLVGDLKSETSGNFEDLLVALMTPIPELLARELHHAISGVGTNEQTLVEIICTATNNEMRAIKAAYHHLYGRSLEEELAGDTSGNFRRLLISLCQANRNENYNIDPNGAFQDAQALMRAGELRLGTDESTFNAILCSRSYPQLAAVFSEYHRLTGNDFENAVRSEFSGDIEAGLVAIVRSVKDKAEFFADQLHDSMSGAGTHDRALIRIVCSRSEIDLGDIKVAYQRKYGRHLSEAVHDDTSGDYKKALLSLIA